MQHAIAASRCKNNFSPVPILHSPKPKSGWPWEPVPCCWWGSASPLVYPIVLGGRCGAAAVARGEGPLARAVLLAFDMVVKRYLPSGDTKTALGGERGIHVVVGADVVSAGSVNCESAGNGRSTTVTVHLQKA